jgi:Protein of unknown function (DUF2612)
MPLYSQSGYGYGRYGIADYGPIGALSIDYYLNLFTSEYKLAPNLNAWMAALLSPLNDTTTMLAGMTEAFDLGNAAGVQLDILGQIAGVSRTVPFQPSDSVSPVLDDATYTILIQATIANNQWDGTQESLQPIWATLFPTGRIAIIDNQNMSATVIIGGALSSIVQDLISNGLIVPRPEGVEYNYVFSNLPIFGFGPNTAIIGGFDRGLWA